VRGAGWFGGRDHRKLVASHILEDITLGECSRHVQREHHWRCLSKMGRGRRTAARGRTTGAALFPLGVEARAPSATSFAMVSPSLGLQTY
jgi:hypothetical protein